ncbi:hypothetical protein N7495_005387 [Penicillium taxi]|uniref:uncharacterized protein n=1 Tax=Penicillium taxi TaxID=168475 RepID=UPI002544D641|nr:uncharacterized protein N7495_005387 [Penicillium taxi]KAJ5893696.1 hypothetical protein N7495_005387 [Penicillium taxi]
MSEVQKNHLPGSKGESERNLELSGDIFALQKYRLRGLNIAETVCKYKDLLRTEISLRENSQCKQAVVQKIAAKILDARADMEDIQ